MAILSQGLTGNFYFKQTLLQGLKLFVEERCINIDYKGVRSPMFNRYRKATEEDLQELDIRITGSWNKKPVPPRDSSDNDPFSSPNDPFFSPIGFRPTKDD